jgi:hypothetical protein
MARLVFVCLLLAAPLAHAQECRDATGEPAPCPAPVTVEATVTSYDVPATPAPAPAAPSEPGPSFFEHSRERTLGYVGWELAFDVVSLGALRFTQAGPERAGEMAREAGVRPPGETVLAGATLLVGVRPVPWLRLPELRLSFGGGDYERRLATWSDGTRQGDASLESLFFLRAEVAAGVELPMGDVAIYALGHVAIAGYFLDARLTHATGDLGTAQLAEDAWELGWTAGIAGHLGGGVYLSAAYRHVHTGAEGHSLRFAISVDVD